MKKNLCSLVVMLFAVTSLNAQQIAVVNASGNTSVYYTLDDAISTAAAGSTIYLPGGGFQVSDDVRIDKKLTIMGIGHKADSDNADGNTTVSGNIQFAPGSAGSAIMGVYMGNEIQIGVGGTVSNITIRYCNVNSIQFKTDSCSNVIVNRNYIRSNSSFGMSNVVISNNIMADVENVDGGEISNNLISGYYNNSGYHYSFWNVDNSTVIDNLGCCGFGRSENALDLNNLIGTDFGSYLVKWDGIKTTSDCHFIDTYEGDQNIGIYGGTGFNDDCLPPMPYIVSKTVSEQTDAQGKLKVQITVKAN